MSNENIGNFTDIDGSENAHRQRLITAMDYLSSIPEVIFWRARAIELLSLSKNAEVLSLGCGPGDSVRLIAKQLSNAGKVIGIDYSDAMLTVAKSRSISANEHYQQGNAESLDLDSDSLDAIYCERVLHHLKHPEKAVSECYRVLKKGGRAIFLEPVFSFINLHPAPVKLARHIADTFLSQVQYGNIGFDLPKLSRTNGFQQIEYSAHLHLWRDYIALDAATDLSSIIRSYDSKNCEAIIASLSNSENDNEFVFSVPIYLICVEK